MSNEGKLIREGQLEFQRVLPADIETVWRFLVEEDLRESWLCGGKVDAFVGGKVEFKFDPANFAQALPPNVSDDALSAEFEGEVLVYAPPTQLAFTWPESDGVMVTQVTITLATTDEGTLLHLVHERLTESEDLVSAAAGWHAHLEQLECKLTRQLSPDFRQRHHELDVAYRKKLKAAWLAEREQDRSIAASKSKTTGRKSMSKQWKTGRGKLGFMQPLIGKWLAIDPDTPMGKVVCVRTYEKVLDGKYIRLDADWDIGDGKKTYQETAYYGVSKDKVPTFWSFTSDGGQSMGTLADVDGMHEGAKGFEAKMPAGLARFGFWPTDTGMIWAAEAQTKAGWKSMIRHECERVE